MKRIYKQANQSETETTINILYREKKVCIYTNKVELQKQLRKAIGEPKQEWIKGRSIIGSTWEIPLGDKSKITKILVKTDLFELSEPPKGGK